MQQRIRLAGCHPPCAANTKGWRAAMSYLIQIANRRPMLRITAEVIIVFCCAAPLVLVVSSLVAYGVHSVMN